jgi:hypothetical protein
VAPVAPVLLVEETPVRIKTPSVALFVVFENVFAVTVNVPTGIIAHTSLSFPSSWTNAEIV